MRDRELSISDGFTGLGVSDSLGGLAIPKCPKRACGGTPDGKRLVIDWEGIQMRACVLRFLVVFLVLLAFAAGGCAHGTYMTQPVAPEQGSSAGGGGGGGGY